MKKTLFGLIFASVFLTATAQHRGEHHHRPRYYNSDWVAPLILGGVIGYSINQSNQAPPPPVVFQQQPPVPVNTYEIVYIDGVAYKRSRMFLNGQWQDVLVRY